jgi:hypothetical protein
MAKKRGGRGPRSNSKSAAIREVLQTHGNKIASKDVIETLASRGIKVSSAHVANVRSRFIRAPGAAAPAAKRGPGRRGRRPGRKPGRRPGRKPGRKPGGAVGQLQDKLLEVKRVAEMVGGIDQARAALDLLAKLQR